MNIIEFKDFSCHYKVKKDFVTALDNINLTVKQGEFLVVVGESGSGKSTLVKSCLGIADYFQGELIIDGTPVEKLDLKKVNFGYVRQEIALYPNLTVFDNIAYPLRTMKVPQLELERRVKEVANMLGLRLFLSRKPNQLSGGQQQRVAIGRTIIKNPNIIFFDEPFSNIDIKLRADLRKLTKDIHQKYGPTIVFVTHDLGEAFTLADRIVVLEKGKIVEIGTPDKLRVNARSELIRTYLNESNSFGKPKTDEEN